MVFKKQTLQCELIMRDESSLPLKRFTALAAEKELLRHRVIVVGFKQPKSRSKPSRYSSENDVLIEKSVKYTDFFLLSIVYV